MTTNRGPKAEELGCAGVVLNWHEATWHPHATKIRGPGRKTRAQGLALGHMDLHVPWSPETEGCTSTFSQIWFFLTILYNFC
jgi:hypothetical protein